jgi:hypothetical protein
LEERKKTRAEERRRGREEEVGRDSTVQRNTNPKKENCRALSDKRRNGDDLNDYTS